MLPIARRLPRVATRVQCVRAFGSQQTVKHASADSDTTTQQGAKLGSKEIHIDSNAQQKAKKQQGTGLKMGKHASADTDTTTRKGMDNLGGKRMFSTSFSKGKSGKADRIEEDTAPSGTGSLQTGGKGDVDSVSWPFLHGRSVGGSAPFAFDQARAPQRTDAKKGEPTPYDQAIKDNLGSKHDSQGKEGRIGDDGALPGSEPLNMKHTYHADKQATMKLEDRKNDSKLSDTKVNAKKDNGGSGKQEGWQYTEPLKKPSAFASAQVDSQKRSYHTSRSLRARTEDSFPKVSTKINRQIGVMSDNLGNNTKQAASNGMEDEGASLSAMGVKVDNDIGLDSEYSEPDRQPKMDNINPADMQSTEGSGQFGNPIDFSREHPKPAVGNVFKSESSTLRPEGQKRMLHTGRDHPQHNQHSNKQHSGGMASESGNLFAKGKQQHVGQQHKGTAMQADMKPTSNARQDNLGQQSPMTTGTSDSAKDNNFLRGPSSHDNAMSHGGSLSSGEQNSIKDKILHAASSPSWWVQHIKSTVSEDAMDNMGASPSQAQQSGTAGSAAGSPVQPNRELRGGPTSTAPPFNNAAIAPHPFSRSKSTPV